MNILSLLSANSFLVVNKSLARKVGLDSAALFADLAGSQLHWESLGKLIDGYFFRSQNDIEEQTTLSAKTQLRCLRMLESEGLVKTKMMGMPYTKHYSIDQSCLAKLLSLFSPNVETRLAKSDKQGSTKGRTIKNRIIENNNIENISIKESAEKSATFENENIDGNISKVEPLVEPLVEPKVKAQSKKESSGFSISLFPANFPFALMPYAEKFFEYRKEIKKPYKSNASITTKLKQFIQETEQHGVQAVIESIETAIGQGWIGTFIDKKYTNNPKQKPTGATIPASDQAQRDELALLKTKCHNKRIDFSNVTGTIQEQIIQIKKLL